VPFPRRSFAVAGIAAVLTATACSGGSPASGRSSSPSAAAAAARAAPDDYLALGDSVAFGYRPMQVTPLSDYGNPAGFTGYPSYVATALHLAVTNASCPGETTDSMINVLAPSNGCENTPGATTGYRQFAPLHVSYVGAQLAFAVQFLKQHPRTELVSINIGANDLFRCQSTTADHCAGADFQQALGQVGRNLDTILAALRHQAGYHGNLVVLTYYALNYADPVNVRETDVLNQVLSGQGERYGARIASGFAAFQPAAAGSRGDTCAAGLRIKLPAGGCDVHPTPRGQQLLAQAVVAVAG
jgi:lysophospholipase L1-like esterase